MHVVLSISYYIVNDVPTVNSVAISIARWLLQKPMQGRQTKPPMPLKIAQKIKNK